LEHHVRVNPLELELVTREVAKRVTAARRNPSDRPWADGYPMEGDRRACLAYLRQLPFFGGRSRSDPFGYYQILEGGVVVGGIGFHGPPSEGMVEVGYGVVPSVRGRGVATDALRQMLRFAASRPDVTRVKGRTTPDNVASQKVMLAAGMTHVGRDSEFLHFEIRTADVS
jgi:RimJ/RimL family protein N-acetyltransferase